MEQVAWDSYPEPITLGPFLDVGNRFGIGIPSYILLQTVSRFGFRISFNHDPL